MSSSGSTKISKVLATLKSGETLTTMDAISRWRYTRLADGIHQLKRKGYRIVTTYHTNADGTRYAAYRLPRAT